MTEQLAGHVEQLAAHHRSDRGPAAGNVTDGLAEDVERGVLVEVTPDAGSLTTRCRLTKVSRAGDIIIEEYEFRVLQDGQPVLEGVTSFGFFTLQALAGHTGIPGDGEDDPSRWFDAKTKPAAATILEDIAPLTPADKSGEPAHGLCLPARAIRMIDRIDRFLSTGGPHRA